MRSTFPFSAFPSLTATAFCLMVLHGPAAAGEWLSDPETGCQVWSEEPQTGEKVFWTGPCADGKADAKGVAVTKIGDELYSRYEGDYAKGKRQGYGVLVFTGGVRYQGEFKDDLFDGSGIWSTIKGDRYDGEFVAGKFHGKGVWETAQGDRYEGDFRNDKIDAGEVGTDRAVGLYRRADE